MKIQINFVLKKSDLKNIDQFLSLLKKKKKKKPNLKMQISLCLEKIIFENTDQFFSFHKRILLAIVDFET